MSFETDVLMDIADVIDSSHKTPTYVKNGVPMARVTDVKYGKLKLANALHVSFETFEEYSRRYKAKQGDIIISRVGSYGNTSWVVDTNFCLGQNVASISPTKIDPRYLYYILNSPYISEQIESLVVGSTQKSLSLKVIRELKIPRRDSIVEQSIGLLLGEIDDRINLLHETNTTLEAIAQALFKSWFVDFDPVHAKQQGRIPEGMDEATAALFPDSFEESELGIVPRGWKISHFETFIDRQSVGKKYDQKSALEEGLVPILDQGKSGIIGFHNDKPSVKASLDEPIVVFANHTCYMRLITFDFSAIQNVLPFRGKNIDTVWAFYATKDRIRFSEYKGHWPDFVIEKATLPSEALTIAFRSFVDPLIRRMRNNEIQSQTLSTLRDTLLPRLISGAIHIKDAEKFTEGADR